MALFHSVVASLEQGVGEEGAFFTEMHVFAVPASFRNFHKSQQFCRIKKKKKSPPPQYSIAQSRIVAHVFLEGLPGSEHMPNKKHLLNLFTKPAYNWW